MYANKMHTIGKYLNNKLQGAEDRKCLESQITKCANKLTSTNILCGQQDDIEMHVIIQPVRILLSVVRTNTRGNIKQIFPMICNLCPMTKKLP